MRIFVGLDLSPSSADLVDRAAEWAERLSGTLHLRAVSALHGAAEAVAGSLETSFVAQDWAAQREAEEAQLRLLAQRVPEHLFSGAEMADGNPATVLSELTVAADLLILGTHARRGMSRLLLGSVADQVVRAAHCPVLVVPLAAAAVPLPDRMVVFCPIALDEDRDLRAALWVRDHLEGVTEFELGHVPTSDDENPHLARGALDDLAAVHELGFSRSHLTPVTAQNPGPALARLASALSANLVAMTTHGRTGPSRLLHGSVAAQLISEASCPVLILR